MSALKYVKESRIKNILENSEIVVNTVFGKHTVVSVKLPNGFVITESTGCIDKNSYSEEIGAEICMAKIEDKLWELEGYSTTVKLDEMTRINKIVQGEK